MKLVSVNPPVFRTVLIAMKFPAPSVGMSARNATFAVKSTWEMAFTTAPMPVPGPGSSPLTLPDVTQGVAPRPVMVTRISIGTE